MTTTLKTALLWLVLALMMGIAYANMKRGSLAALVFVLLAFGVIVAVGWLNRRRPHLKVANEALELFNRGRYAKALEKWQAADQLKPGEPVTRANIGMARAHLWQLAGAREDLLAALENKQLPAQYQPFIRAQLMAVVALEGRLDEARRHAELLLKQQPEPLPLMVLAEAVVDLREGRTALAHTRLRSSEIKQLQGSYAVLANCLDAWCIKLSRNELRHVDTVALFAESSGEGLNAAWPEFAAFLSEAPQS